jgi:hypothetical protein
MISRKIFLWAAAAALGLSALGLVLSPTGGAEPAAEVVRTLETGPDGLERFHALALADEDTRLVEGSVAEGDAVYATRSRSMMFLADTHYTIATLKDGVLTLTAPSAALRRGVAANRERLNFWIAYLRDTGS